MRTLPEEKGWMGMSQMFSIMTISHGLMARNPAMAPGSPKKIDVPQYDAVAERAYDLMKASDSQLPEKTGTSWK